MSASAWLRCMKPNPTARVQLVCFAHAGGGAHVFRGWSERLSSAEVWAAILPGHVGRLNDPLPTDLLATARSIADAVRVQLARPVALFGHSMGAWLALEVARALADARPVATLVAAGRNGPGRPDDRPPISALPDARFLEEVQARYGGVSADVAAHAEIRELFLPIIRADIAMMERYDPRSGVPLACPVLACSGLADAGVSPAGLAAWSRVTTGHFEAMQLPGGHFFIERDAEPLLDALATWIDRQL